MWLSNLQHMHTLSATTGNIKPTFREVISFILNFYIYQCIWLDEFACSQCLFHSLHVIFKAIFPCTNLLLKTTGILMWINGKIQLCLYNAQFDSFYREKSIPFFILPYSTESSLATYQTWVRDELEDEKQGGT